jgi:hypothetical protein
MRVEVDSDVAMQQLGFGNLSYGDQWPLVCGEERQGL